jgi:predicted Rossmann-fold nucleotide-binding protein
MMSADANAVAVFCASSRRCPPGLVKAARRMGELIGARGWRLVYGGTDVGLMKEVADAAKAAGGGVTGVIPRFMVEKGSPGPPATT